MRRARATTRTRDASGECAARRCRSRGARRDARRRCGRGRRRHRVPVDAAVDILRRLAPFATNARADHGRRKHEGAHRREPRAQRRARRSVRRLASDGRRSSIRMGGVTRRPLRGRARLSLSDAQRERGRRVALAGEFWRDARRRVRSAWTPTRHDRQARVDQSSAAHRVDGARAGAGEAGIGRDDLGPGGRDVTRLAGSSPDMWTAIAHENAAAIDAALAAAEREVASFRRALERADAGELRNKFPRLAPGSTGSANPLTPPTMPNSQGWFVWHELATTDPPPRKRSTRRSRRGTRSHRRCPTATG